MNFGGKFPWKFVVLPHSGEGSCQLLLSIPDRSGLIFFRSNRTVYAKQNGGQFDFVMDGYRSLPLQQEFWDFLFSKAVQWGLMVYEQVLFL